MKFSFCCLFLTVVGFSNGSSSLLSAFSKAFKKFSLLGSVGGGPPTTPPPPSRSSHVPWISHAPTPTSPPTYPPELKCDVIWEEKVTPLCKTVQEKICKTDEKENCHKIWEDKCWDEPVEDCHPKEECNHVLENVCKTEYIVTCDKEHGGGGVDEYEAAGGLGRHRRAIQGLFPALGGLGGGKVEPQPEPEPEPEPTTPQPHEELCHHHPETTCWDEPVEKCETILECTLDVKNLCKKVPKEVCEQVSVENCWEEPSEKCEYMMVKVARKHCRDLHENPKH